MDNTALTWQPEGKRKVGRLKSTWRRTTKQGRTELGWKSWASAKQGQEIEAGGFSVSGLMCQWARRG
jgi:hypothetical protein